MINPFKIGDKKHFTRVVSEKDLAEFEAGLVHAFYATFALTRDAEWASRLFVLEMKEEDEEGIGTYIHIDHLSPAFLGDSVDLTAILVKVEGNATHCTIEARVGDRLIAKGKSGQKILKKTKLEAIISNFNG